MPSTSPTVAIRSKFPIACDVTPALAASCSRNLICNSDLVNGAFTCTFSTDFKPCICCFNCWLASSNFSGSLPVSKTDTSLAAISLRKAKRMSLNFASSPRNLSSNSFCVILRWLYGFKRIRISPLLISLTPAVMNTKSTSSSSRKVRSIFRKISSVCCIRLLGGKVTSIWLIPISPLGTKPVGNKGIIITETNKIAEPINNVVLRKCNAFSSNAK